MVDGTPKELCNKHKLTRDVNGSIRDYVIAFVCRTKLGQRKHVEEAGRLGLHVLKQKSPVFFKHVCCTWMLNMGRTANS